MAVVYNEQPTDRTGCLSPVIYQVYDAANVAQAGFYYEFEVYVWSGSAAFPVTPVATINRKPDVYGGDRGWIDIREIIQQEIERDITFSGTYQPNIQAGVKRVGVKCRGVWNASAGSQVSSNIQLITAGYNYTSDGFNADYSAKDVYTDRSIIYLTEDTTEFYLWFNPNTCTSIDVGAYSETPNAIVDSNEEIQGIDIVQLMSNASLTGADSTITFAGAAVDIEVKYLCQSRWGSVLVHYLNRYGVYESFVFNALSKKTTNFTNETYNQPIYKTSSLDADFSTGVAITTSFVEQSMTRLIVNTDYIPEEYNDIIEQIIISRNSLTIDNSFLTSIRCTDKSLTRKTRVNDKLVQYTLTFEYNQPKINTIAR